MEQKVHTAVYITTSQHRRLRECKKELQVPIAVMIRRGVDLALEDYEARADGFKRTFSGGAG